MRIEQGHTNEKCFTSIVNLYHLFYVHNIKEVLIDTRCKKYIDSVFITITQLRVDFNITDALEPDYLRAKDLNKKDIPDFLQHSKLKPKYDLIIVHANNFDSFC